MKVDYLRGGSDRQQKEALLMEMVYVLLIYTDINFSNDQVFDIDFNRIRVH